MLSLTLMSHLLGDNKRKFDIYALEVARQLICVVFDKLKINRNAYFIAMLEKKILWCSLLYCISEARLI